MNEIEVTRELIQDLFNGEIKPFESEEKYISIAQQIIEISVEHELNNKEFM